MTHDALAEALEFAGARLEVAKLEVEHGDVDAAAREILRATERLETTIRELRAA